MRARGVTVLLCLVALYVAAGCGSSSGPVAEPEDGSGSGAGPDGALAYADDVAGDVSSRPDARVGAETRNGIELRGLTVTRQGRTAVRFTVDVRRVDRSEGVTQVYLIDVDGTGFEFGQMLVATHPQGTPVSRDGLERSIVLEGADTAEGYVECRDMEMSLEDGADTWWVDVPRRCLPRTPAKLSVYAQTLPGPSNDAPADPWSDDTLTVPGRHQLGGTVPPQASPG